MRRVSTATCTSGEPVSPSWARCSWIISSLFSTTANFFFLLFFSVLFLRLSSQSIQSHMLPHASKGIVGYPPRLVHVPRNLLLELLDTAKPLLRPDPPHEAHVDDASVEVTLEVEEVRLHAALAPLEGRRDADVGARRVALLPHVHEPGVHPAGGDHEGRIGEHVGRREADASPAPVAYDHLAPQQVRPPQKLRGLLHLAPGDQSPDAGGADPALPRSATPDGYRVGVTAVRPHDPPDVLEVPRGPVPEPEVLPDHDGLRPDLTEQHVPNEVPRALLRKLLVEPDRPYLVRPKP